MLLPVIGAWVGAVLAFYFGNENFDAASKSAANLVSELSPREKLKAESAKSEADVTIKQLIDDHA